MVHWVSGSSCLVTLAGDIGATIGLENRSAQTNQVSSTRWWITIDEWQQQQKYTALLKSHCTVDVFVVKLVFVDHVVGGDGVVVVVLLLVVLMVVMMLVVVAVVVVVIVIVLWGVVAAAMDMAILVSRFTVCRPNCYFCHECSVLCMNYLQFISQLICITERKYLWWSLHALYLPARQLRDTTGDSGLCCVLFFLFVRRLPSAADSISLLIVRRLL